MSLSLRIVLVVIVVSYLFVIIKSIRKKKLQINYCIFWIIISLLLIIALCIPNFIEQISGMLGFEVPSNMVFCITIFIAFYLIFVLTLKISQEDAKTRKLIQEISILNRKFDMLEMKNEREKERKNETGK